MKSLRDIVAGFFKPTLAPRAFGYESEALPGQAIRHPSEVLGRYDGGKGLKYLRDVREALGFVAGIIDLRIDAALALPHSTQAGDENDEESKRVAGICDRAVNAIDNWVGSARCALMSIADGVTFNELVWGTYEDASGEMILAPVRMLELPVESMGFDKDGAVIMSQMGSAKPVAIDPAQILVSRYGSGNVWGKGEMLKALTDCWKLDWVDRKGFETLDKQGMPLQIIYVPESWDDQTIVRRTAFAVKRYKNVIVLPQGDRFYLEPAPDQSSFPTYIGDDQIKRITKLEDSVSVALLGVSFSNSFARHSGNDQAAVKDEMRFEKTPGDAATHDANRQHLFDLICAVNWPNLPKTKRPIAATDSTPTVDVAQRLKVYETGQTLGANLSRDEFLSDFGVSGAETEEDVFKAPTTPADHATVSADPTAAPAIDPTADAAKSAATAVLLNGAQVTSATAIVVAVANGTLPRDSGLGQLQVLFNLTKEQAAIIMGSAGDPSVETTPNPRPTDAAQPSAPPKLDPNAITVMSEDGDIHAFSQATLAALFAASSGQ